MKKFLAMFVFSVLCIMKNGEFYTIPCVTDYKIQNNMVFFQQGNNPIPQFVFLNYFMSDYVCADDSRNF